MSQPTTTINAIETTAGLEQSEEVSVPTTVPQIALWKVGLCFVMCAAAIAGMFYVGWMPKLAAKQALADEVERRTKTPAEVRVMSPTPAEASLKTLLPGEIQPWEVTAIYPRISGYVKVWHADIGDSVEQGSVLAEIEIPEIAQELNEAIAEVEELKSRKKVAEASTDLARFTFERFEKLLAQGVLTQQEYDVQQAELSVAENQVESAQAAIEAAEAKVQRIREMKSFATVVAPFDGVITERNVERGQLVSAGSEQVKSLFRLTRTDLVRVVVNVPQVYASGLEQNQDAELLIRELPDEVFQGTVSRTSKSLDLRTRTMRVEIMFENPEGKLLTGSFVQVRLPVTRNNPPLIVPATALMFNADGAQIAVVDSESKIELRDVEVEIERGTTLGITRGIQPSDRVVINAGERLRNGLPVTVVENNDET